MTHMTPIIEHCNTLPGGILIIFTDGYIESEPLRSKNPTLWMISEDGVDTFTHHGKKIKLNNIKNNDKD